MNVICSILSEIINRRDIGPESTLYEGSQVDGYTEVLTTSKVLRFLEKANFAICCHCCVSCSLLSCCCSKCICLLDCLLLVRNYSILIFEGLRIEQTHKN